MIHIHSLQSSHQPIWLEYVGACSCWKEIEVFKPPFFNSECGILNNFRWLYCKVVGEGQKNSDCSLHLELFLISDKCAG